jgi:hypothetical protein
MPKPIQQNDSKLLKGATNLFSYINQNILALNQSKIFAGIMIVILNIASKFVTINVSKTMESYLKFTFSRDILVFAITWMGTRDIYTALIMTLCFIIIIDFIMNEESQYCMLPESFTDYHVSKLQNNCPSPEEVAKAKAVIAADEKCKKEKEKDNEANPTNTKVVPLIDSNYSGLSSAGY